MARRFHRAFSTAVLGSLISLPSMVTAQDAPTRRVVDVDWPAAGLTEPGPRLPPAVATQAAAVRLPVLVPMRFPRFKSFDLVTVGPYDYTASVRPTGAKISVNGTRQAVDPPPGAAAALQNEPSADADDAGFAAPDPLDQILVNRSFTRFGVAYLITIECASAGDRRCTDAFAAELEASMRLVGGAQ